MTEKSPQEQQAAQRQIELLTQALEKAKTNGGVLLNAEGKTAAQFYPKGTSVSPFNSLTLALHSDAMEYKTNLYTLFSEAKKRGESVQTGQKGVPFVWYSWNEYQNKANSEEKISREEYSKLSPEEQSAYKPLREREIRTLFNIEQTTLPFAAKEEFEKIVKEHGPESSRDFSEKDDKQRRMEINDFLQNIKDNLIPLRKDGTGIAHYDSTKDVIYIPAQKHFSSYADYVQESIRQIATATGHPQRLGRQGMYVEGGHVPTQEQQQRERLVVELASAVKMSQMGMPGKISKESLSLIDGWQKELKENPNYIVAIEADVNNTLGMIAKAERGEKVEKTPTLEPAEAQTDTVNGKVVMLRDDENHWALYIKPETEKGFAVYPDKADVNRFFVTAKQGNDLLTEKVRQELAQKYYSQASAHPEQKIDLFKTTATDIDLSQIQRVNIFKTKSEESKILCLPTIEGMDKLKPREVSPSQWQRMWIAEDKQEYKRNLAATLFQDVLREQQKKDQQKLVKEQEEEKRRNSPEQKEKERREEKAKEELTKAETKVVASIVLSPMLKQFNDLKQKHPDALILFRAGDFYQTYKEDARKASNILGITLTRSDKMKDESGKSLEMAGFPYHALDTYLPKLIRAGERVAICDQLELNKRLAEQESVKPKVEQKQEEQSRGYHR